MKIAPVVWGSLLSSQLVSHAGKSFGALLDKSIPRNFQAKIRTILTVSFGVGLFCSSSRALAQGDAGTSKTPGQKTRIESTGTDVGQLFHIFGGGNGSAATASPALPPGPAAPVPTPQSRVVNLSTRLLVGTGNSVAVGGFVVTGTAPKNVLFRAIGPSLSGLGVPNPLADPLLELHGPAGFATITNNNWRDTQEAEIIATGFAPTNDLESAILVTLAPGSYSTILQGNGNTSGTALMEVYDLDPSTPSRLASLSTRAFIGTGNDIMIAGINLGGGSDTDPIVFRGIGPSLGAAGISPALADPTLELRDANGTLLIADNDWQDDPVQAAEITAAGLEPTNPLEAAIATTLSPGTYTVLMAGLSNGTGIGVLEIHDDFINGLPPVITSPITALVTVGQLFVYQFEASDATSLSVTNLPPDLTFDPILSAITGIPSTAGKFQVGLSATNSQGTTNTTLTITVQPAPTAGPVIFSGTSATGRVGQPFLFHVMTTGGSPAARLDTVNLPSGLNADPVTGIISGTPTIAGSSTVTLTVTDGNFVTSSELALTFVSDPARPVIVSSDSAALAEGQPFSYAIVAPPDAGPSDPTVFAELGQLPAGLGLDPVTGIISGIYSPRPDGFSGGTLVGLVQIFGTNSHGTGTIQLYLHLTSPGIVNISTRMPVGTDNNVLIGGFIVTGDAPRGAIIRAIGPSLTSGAIPNPLPDPILSLFDSTGLIAMNNNWRDSQEQIVINTTIPPTSNFESAVVLALSPGNSDQPGTYTATVSGNNGGTGIGAVELYDLGPAGLNVDGNGNSKFANISTRGLVQTGNDVMIGGFIISTTNTRVILRAIGPSLSGSVSGALPDTVLELHNGNTTLATNDNWRSDQEAEIIATMIPPSNDLESAIVMTLPPGAYTAIVKGKNDATGVALVEIYSLPPLP